jgi:hypothetical protein
MRLRKNIKTHNSTGKWDHLFRNDGLIFIGVRLLCAAPLQKGLRWLHTLLKQKELSTRMKNRARFKPLVKNARARNM